MLIRQAFCFRSADRAAACCGHPNRPLRRLCTQVHPLPKIDSQPGKRTHTILVLDRSGSMTGSPWETLDAGVVDGIQRHCRGPLSIVKFSSEAERVFDTNEVLSPDKRKAATRAVTEGWEYDKQGTNIEAAMLSIISICTALPKDVHPVVLFFSDGHATAGGIRAGTELAAMLNMLRNITFHSLLFTGCSDEKLARCISDVTADKGGGMIKYARDVEELTEALQDIFVCINLTDDVVVAVDKVERFIPAEKTGSMTPLFFPTKDAALTETTVCLKIIPPAGAHVEYPHTLSEVLASSQGRINDDAAHAWVNLARSYEKFASASDELQTHAQTSTGGDAPNAHAAETTQALQNAITLIAKLQVVPCPQEQQEHDGFMLIENPADKPTHRSLTANAMAREARDVERYLAAVGAREAERTPTAYDHPLQPCIFSMGGGVDTAGEEAEQPVYRNLSAADYDSIPAGQAMPVYRGLSANSSAPPKRPTDANADARHLLASLKVRRCTARAA